MSPEIPGIEPEEENNSQEDHQEPEIPQGDSSRLRYYHFGPVVGPEGFTRPDAGASIALGEEEDILQYLREKGYSEEALKAFKSGKAIIVNHYNTPFGVYREEKWVGKDEEPTDSDHETD